MLAAHAGHDTDPLTGVAFEGRELVRVNGISDMASNHWSVLGRGQANILHSNGATRSGPLFAECGRKNSAFGFAISIYESIHDGRYYQAFGHDNDV
jgi:hypothetical protein